MRELLLSDLCGWPSSRVASLSEVATPPELARHLVELVKDVEDVLLVYYVGHGMRTANGQLALALADSNADPQLLPHTATTYEAIAGILRACPATTKLVILDCCHAELANKAHYQFQSADVIDAEPVDGLYFVGASRRWEKALSPLDGGLPYFTDAFINVVLAGIPGKPSQLTIDQIFVDLRARLLRAGLPEPVQSGIRDAHHWPFARNAAPPRMHRDPELEIVLLTKQLAESQNAATAKQQALEALEAEVERLRIQVALAETGQQRQELQTAIDTAERLIEDTVAETDGQGSTLADSASLGSARLVATEQPAPNHVSGLAKPNALEQPEVADSVERTAPTPPAATMERQTSAEERQGRRSQDGQVPLEPTVGGLPPRRTRVLTPAPQPTGPRVIRPARVPAQDWGVKANPGYVGPKTPTDVKIVIGALIAVDAATGVLISILANNAIIGGTVAGVMFLALIAFLWFGRL